MQQEQAQQQHQQQQMTSPQKMTSPQGGTMNIMEELVRKEEFLRKDARERLHQFQSLKMPVVPQPQPKGLYSCLPLLLLQSRNAPNIFHCFCCNPEMLQTCTDM